MVFATRPSFNHRATQPRRQRLIVDWSSHSSLCSFVAIVALTHQQCLTGEGLQHVVQLGTSGRPREGAAESRHEFLACPRPVEQREQLSTEGILIPECLVIETWNDLVLAIEPARCGESLGTFAVSLFASG
jgi:hypothetical protein